MSQPVIVPHPNTIRGPIESEYNDLRLGIEEQYVEDKLDLEKTYYSDLAANAAAKAQALIAAGLNWDGSVPPDYPQTADPGDVAVLTITGTPTVGEELTAHTSGWLHSPVLAYQWERADSDGSNNVDISEATDSTYTLVDDDDGKTVRVTVTATNPEGVETISSDYTEVVGPPAPTNTVVPTVTGTTTVGEVLTAHDGTWTDDPVITYQWEREDADGSNGADIADETDATYTLVSDDEGKKVRVTLTGTNPGGAVAAHSAWSAAIAAGGG